MAEPKAEGLVEDTREISFQPAAPEERDWLFALHERAMRPMVELTYGEWNVVRQRAKFDSRTETDVRIVLHGGERVGAVHLEDKPDGSLYVGLIEIDPAFQNRGLGAQVLDRLAAEAAASGRAMTLSVRPANVAKRLYERVGFRVTHSDETHFHMRRETAAAPASESGGPSPS